MLLAERDTVPEPPLPPGQEPAGLLGFVTTVFRMYYRGFHHGKGEQARS